MSARFIIAHDLDEENDRWFVVDKRKAEARAGSWAEADVMRADLERRSREGRQ